MDNVHPLVNDLDAPPPEITVDDAPPRPETGGARRAAAWTAGGFAAQQVLRLGFNIILTRLIVPKVMGMMVLIGLFVQFLHMLSDLGIRHCIVQHPDGESPEFLRTAWTLQVLRGLVMWIGSALMALPVAVIYGVPMYTWLLPLAGTVAAIDGLGSTAVYVLGRRLHRGPVVRMELTCYIIGTTASIVGIWLVSRGREPGSDPAHDPLTRDQLVMLVGGSLLSMSLQAILSHRLLREVKHYFHWDRAAARELLHFGGWIFLGTACYFIAGQADRLAIGKDQAELGIYNPAVQLAMVPHALLYELLAQLALPVYARKLLSDDRTGMRTVHLALGLLGAVLVSGLIAVGPTFVECIYRPNYRPDQIGFFTQLLAAGAWFGILQYAHEVVVVAGGQSRPGALAQVVKLILIVPCMLVGYRSGGLIGMVIGFKVPELVRYAMLAVTTARKGHPLWRDDIVLTCGIAVSALGVFVGQRWLWGDLNKFVRLPVETLAVLTVWGAFALPLWWAGRLTALRVRREEAVAC